MLKPLPQVENSISNADKGYDSNKNCELVCAKKMKPNVKHRENTGKKQGPKIQKEGCGGI
jgi:hypothetical protein